MLINRLWLVNISKVQKNFEVKMGQINMLRAN